MPARTAPLLALAALLGCAAGPGEPIAKHAILVVVDTLRWDHVGIYGAARDTTPALDAWAERSVRFERAYASAPWTKASVASLFSGLYPSAHGTRAAGDRLADGIDTLAERLAAEGFETFGVVSHSLLKEKWGFAQGFGTVHDREARGHDHVSTAGVTRSAVEFLERRAAQPGRFFLFVHYFDPHYAYRRHADIGFAPEGTDVIDGSESFRELRRLRPELGAAEIALLRALYDEEIRHTDAGFGLLLERLQALGLAEDTVVIFTADHGEEFLDHGHLGHTRSLYEELVRVPLVVGVHGARARSVPDPVSLVSVAPTLLDLLGLDGAASGFEAPSLAAAVRGGDLDAGPVYSEVDYRPLRSREAAVAFRKKAVIGPRFKLIVDDETGESELYDLRSDPGERRNLAADRPDELARLIALLGGHLRRAVDAPGRAVDAPRLDEEEIEQLRGLGYLE